MPTSVVLTFRAPDLSDPLLRDANLSGAYLEKAIPGQSVARSYPLSIIKKAFHHFVQITIKTLARTSFPEL